MKLVTFTYLFLYEDSLCLQVGFEVLHSDDGILNKFALPCRFLLMLNNQIFQVIHFSFKYFLNGGFVSFNFFTLLYHLHLLNVQLKPLQRVFPLVRQLT